MEINEDNYTIFVGQIGDYVLMVDIPYRTDKRTKEGKLYERLKECILELDDVAAKLGLKTNNILVNTE